MLAHRASVVVRYSYAFLALVHSFHVWGSVQEYGMLVRLE